jgi:hypothetical protein
MRVGGIQGGGRLGGTAVASWMRNLCRLLHAVRHWKLQWSPWLGQAAEHRGKPNEFLMLRVLDWSPNPKTSGALCRYVFHHVVGVPETEVEGGCGR